MDRSSARLIALLTGIAVGGGTRYWLVADPVFAAAVGLFWAVGVGLSVRHREWMFDPSSDRNGQRWSGAFGGLCALAATIGVSPDLPLSNELRFGLGLLVVGVALTMVNVGIGMVLDGRGGPDGGDAPRTDGADENPDRDAADPA